MPIIGERRSHRPGSNGYTNDAMAGFTRAFLNEANSILEEDRLDIFSEPAKVLRRDMSDEALRTFFVEGSADKNVSAWVGVKFKANCEGLDNNELTHSLGIPFNKNVFASGHCLTSSSITKHAAFWPA